jgi:hypothetical protein
VATTGVVGQRWRATVTSAGVVEPHDGSAALGWHVAADDRWHDPRTDTGVRHRRIAGTAVFETRLRIPGGDAIQRVWSVADGGGYSLVSVHNDSPAPIAVAFTRGDIATNRPPADAPIEGATLPAGSVALPVGHRATITVGLAHSGAGRSSLPAGLPTDDAVVRGWSTRTDVASRLDLPEPALVEAVRAARCELLLAGVADPETEPERHLLGVGELVRLGDLDTSGAVEAVASVAAAVVATVRRGHDLAAVALDAAGVVLSVAGETRALDDLARLRRDSVKGRGQGEPIVGSDDVALIPIVERRLVEGSMLFPGGIPTVWRGTNFEAHRLVAGPDSRVSLAVRWHGADAAVLWEIHGTPIPLSTRVGGRAWSTSEPRGEALWRLPPR